MKLHRSVSVALFAALSSAAAAQVRIVDADALPRVALVREQRIGHADDPKLSFNRVRHVEVGRDGRMYVYDSQTANIRVFARDGSLIQTIGGPGSGPGEFSARFGPAAFGMLGDSLWSFETLGTRVNVF